MVCDCGDPSSFAWFLEWPAYALTHGHSLFLATRAQVPAGMNLLDNTSVLALGVLLTPVTLVFGPIASLNAALTAAPALSALAAYGVLRRALGVSGPAAFVGGLMFGFSPFIMRNEAINHLQVTFLALVPLIFWCCYELAVSQRGKWWRWGLALGVVVAVQFFIGLEVLTITVLTTAGALLAAFLAALSRPGVLSAKLPFAWRGFALSGGVAAVLLAYPLWFTIDGPERIKGADWAYATTNGLARVFLPLSQSAFQQRHLPDIGYLGPAGTLGGYLGVAAVLALLAAVVIVRRPLTGLCAVIGVVAIWLSLGSAPLAVSHGGEPGWLPLPWRALHYLPVLNKITPANFSVAAVSAAVVASALLLDWVWRQRSDDPVSLRSVRLPRWALADAGVLAISAALVVPWAVAWPLPFRTELVTTPAPVARVLDRLSPDAVVLFYPFPSSYLDQALVWQARTGLRFAVVGGRGITAGPNGAADHGLSRSTPVGKLSALTTSYAPHAYLPLPKPPTPPVISSFRRALRHWGVTDILLTGAPRDPGYARRWLTTVLGTPPQRHDGLWLWANVRRLSS
jgi:hypothetical protein